MRLVLRILPGQSFNPRAQGLQVARQLGQPLSRCIAHEPRGQQTAQLGFNVLACIRPGSRLHCRKAFANIREHPQTSQQHGFKLIRPGDYLRLAALQHREKVRLGVGCSAVHRHGLQVTGIHQVFK